MSFYSPLRYPGGKAKVAEYFKQVIKDNLLCDGVYVEPYAGGSSIALALLFNEYVSRVIINDIDRAIFAFWYSVLNKTNELCKLINDTPVNIVSWEKQKLIYKDKEKSGLLELGFSTFFLNRTNRSGILKAGVIGGRRQEGKWKIGARFNKSDLISRIKRIAAYKKRIELYNLNAVELVRSLRRTLPKKTLFYFDPPYYIKGKDLYYNYYGDKDHNEIAIEINKIKKQKWILTYDSVPYIKQLYKNYRQFRYTLNYSAASFCKGEEVMIPSDDLYLQDDNINISQTNSDSKTRGCF